MPRLRAFAPTQNDVMAKSMHRTAITRLSQLRLVLLLVCIASRPNDPAQARVATNVRSDTAAQTRPCLEPVGGWADDLRGTSEMSALVPCLVCLLLNYSMAPESPRRLASIPLLVRAVRLQARFFTTRTILSKQSFEVFHCGSEMRAAVCPTIALTGARPMTLDMETEPRPGVQC